MPQRHRPTGASSVKPGLSVFAGCIVATHAFFASHFSTNTRSSGARFARSVEQVVFYSPNFHRHVVAEFAGQNCSSILESFLFLDEAEEKYPTVQRIETKHSSKLETIMGLGMIGLDDYKNTCMQLAAGKVPATIPSAIPMDRLELVIEKLSSILGSPFASFFPDDEHDLVFERIRYLLAPMPDFKMRDMDVPKAFFDGYGAGFSENQVVSSILALRHLLLADPAAALKEKPPTTYFVGALGVSVELLNEARNKMAHWLDGECAEDAATFAYLKMLGVSWDQCDLLLQAFSASLISCELERTWEAFDRASPLSRSSIEYLRTRLQLPPSEVMSMMRIHSRLSTYSAWVLKSHSDALQSGLGLSSRGLKELILGSPSVLGISEKKAQLRAAFLRERLTLSVPEIQKVLKNVPTVLSYSLENNLVPKVDFLSSNAGISGQNLTKVIVARPYILALSLEKSLKPCVVGLREQCDLSVEELGDVLVRAPLLLTSKWKTVLEPKINYLMDRLILNTGSLKKIVMASPRILVHSVATSLEPKLRLLENVAGNDTTLVAQVVRDNPSLLESSKAKLEKRVSLYKLRNVTFVEAFSPRSRTMNGDARKIGKPLTRRKRSVLEIMADGSVIQRWPDVDAAAVATGANRANMYHILKTGREYNGRKYVYGSLPELPAPEDDTAAIPTEVRNNVVPSLGGKKVGLAAILRDSPLTAQIDKFSATDETWSKSPVISLSVFVSSGVYRAEKRAKLTAGGLWMYFPQLAGSHEAGKALEKAADSCFPYQVIPPNDGETNYFRGIVLSTYPAPRPSRNRCGLFVCRSALRLVLELLVSDPSLINCDVEVNVITDSNYIWELLRDPVALLRWGFYSSAKDFVYDGSEPSWKVNADILYPLARTYYRMTNQIFASTFLASLGDGTNAVAKSIKIRFRHESEYSWTREDPQIRQGRKFAKAAAKWQYDRVYSDSTIP